MSKLGVLGIAGFAYLGFVIFYNFVNVFFRVLPDLGVFGSWFFNPLGMLFSANLGQAIISQAGDGALIANWFSGGAVQDAAVLFAGGVLAFVWCVVVAVVSWLFRKFG